MKKIITLGLFFAFCFSDPLKPINFSLIKQETFPQSPTLLIMGGIQGDEPGGFNATNIFLKHYRIKKGNVWVVPVLNKHSMLYNHRGIFDDMNRKFAKLSLDDPEYLLIENIKSLINTPQISAILHLHDGSGFYRHTYENKLFNPNRWGNSSIIDQEILEGIQYGNLKEIATKMTEYINQQLLNPIHRYHIRNTHTAKGDVEMEKALTYFAIKHNKPAFANEASKELSVERRVYYHLLAIEGLLDQLGIVYEKDFKLTPSVLYGLINDKSLNVKIDNNIFLPLYGLRSHLKYFPLPKGADIPNISLESKAYIVGLLPKYNQVYLKYGNKLMTRLYPEYLEFDYSLKEISIKIDGREKNIPIGSMISVKENFEILPIDGYRVNIIGYVIPGDKSLKPNETGILIHHKNCIPRFSIDKAGKIFRVEMYKDEKFSGMILVKFL